ncbi:MAG: glycosyltransferase family 4 protein [Chloroflexi bacterium]|nr:glycosyltransferase family 4 protein [Chloroflexota bacterium]
MRLVFLTSTPLSVRDGSGTYVGVTVLQQALIEQGHHIALVAPAPGPMPLGHAVQRLAFNTSAGRRLAALRPVPDGIVGFDLDGCLLDRRRPFVASIKGVLAEELTFEQGPVRFSLWVQSRFERLNVRRSALVLTTSQYARQAIAANYRVPTARIAVVPEPIDLGRWRVALADAGDRAAWTPTILTVCHLYPRKRVDVLLRAMPRVLRAVPDARLCIVGVGPEADRLRALHARLGLGDTTTFLGHVPFDALTRAYRDCAVFCLPSRQEGFGIVLLEAMAAGRPIVACRAAAMPEVAPDGQASRLVPPDDPTALAAALIDLLLNRDQAERLGRQGAARVAAYDAPRVAERFAATIAPMMARAPAGNGAIVR